MTFLSLACVTALAAGSLDIDAWSPSEAPAAAPRVFGGAHVQAGVNVRPDLNPNPDDALARNLFEVWSRGNLGVDFSLSSAVRVVLEGRAFWRGTTEPDFARAKATFEPTVGEAYLDWYTPHVDLRAGNQVVSFGANPLFAPADLLNPRDLRWGFLQAEPEVVKLPAAAVRASGEWGRWAWTAVYFPFFEPDRYDVFGTNEALLQPTAGLSVPASSSSSVEDALQAHLLETARPNAWPWLGDLGLRATAAVGRFKVGASWVWMNEKLPEVTVDPELSALLTAHARGQPLDPALALSVENRFLAGQTLFSGIYQRQHILSGESSVLVGSAQLDLDVSFSPLQTFVNQNLDAVRKPSVTWVVGLSQAKDSPWVYNLTYLGMAIPGVHADELLLLVEPATAQGAERSAWLHVLVGTLGYKFQDDLELSFRGAVEPIQGSGALGPRVAYQLKDRFRFWAAAELYQGKPLSPFGYLNRANQVLVGADASY